MEQKAIYNGHPYSDSALGNREPARDHRPTADRDAQNGVCGRPPGRILHFPEKSDGNRTGTATII